jgi:hypothetical protein
MTSTSEVPTRQSVSQAGRGWSYVREIWSATAIALMWLAVLLTGVYGGDAVFIGNDGSSTRLPAVVFVAFFAFLATAAVAKRAFGSARTSSDDRR